MEEGKQEVTLHEAGMRLLEADFRAAQSLLSDDEMQGIYEESGALYRKVASWRKPSHTDISSLFGEASTLPEKEFFELVSEIDVLFDSQIRKARME